MLRSALVVILLFQASVCWAGELCTDLGDCATQIKSAYEAQADTNAFTDAEKAKLAGIESLASADQAATEVPIADEGAFFGINSVEAALQELGDQADRRQVWSVCNSGCTHGSLGAALSEVASTPIDTDTVGIVRVVELRDREIVETQALSIPESTIVTCRDRSLVSLQSSNTADCKVLFLPSLGSPAAGDLVTMGRHTALTDIELYFAGGITGPLNVVKYAGGGATSYGSLLNVKVRGQVSSGISATNPVNLILADTSGGSQYLTWRGLDLHPVISSGNEYVTLLSAQGTTLAYGSGGWFRSNGVTPGRGVHAQDTSKVWLYETLVGVEGGGGAFSVAALEAANTASIWTNGEPVDSAVGEVIWGQRIRAWMSMSFPDSGDEEAAVAEINPTSEVCFLDCQDADGCDLSLGEGPVRQGQSIQLVNSGSNDIRIAEIAGQVVNAGGGELTLTPSFPSAGWIYDGGAWQGATPLPGGGGGFSGLSGSGTSGSIATWSGSTSLADSILSVIAGDLTLSSGKLLLPMGSTSGLRFGDGDSGLYESSDDFLYWTSGSTVLMRGSLNAFGSPSIQFGTGNHTPQLMVETGSATNPVFVGRNDFTSGMSVLSGEVNLISNGSNRLQATSSGVAISDLLRLVPVADLPDCDGSIPGGLQHDSTGPALCWCDGANWQVITGTGPCQ